MRFIAPLFAAFAALASAQNAFNVPTSGYSVTAGQSTTFSWSPTTSGTVSLVLRNGLSTDLNAGTLIASGLTNSGSYTWAVPSSVVQGSDYTIEIIDDENPNITNYTPDFTIDSTVTSATTTAIYTSGAPTSASAAASAASATSSALAAASSVRSSLQNVATSAAGSTASMVSSATKAASSVVGSASTAAASATGGATHVGAPVAGLLAVGAWVAYVL